MNDTPIFRKQAIQRTLAGPVVLRAATGIAIVVALLCPGSRQAIAAPAVVTRSYDNCRTGANTSETSLTPASVARGLKILYQLQIPDDPRIEAQPLYVPGLTMNDGKKRNVVYVFSMANTVWAFDADTGSKIWQKPVSLGAPFVPKVTSKPDQHRQTEIDLYGINISWGILSTPVIDLDAQRIYVANWIYTNAHTALTLHALSLKDGSECPGSPVPIRASVNPGSTNQVSLNQGQKSRAALLLTPLTGSAGSGARKVLCVAFTGGESPGDPHGWVVAFNPETLQQIAAWIATPNSFGGGIWQGAQGPASDDAGNIYFMTGNGGFTVDHNGKTTDFSGTSDFAEAFIKLSFNASAPDGAKLALSDWFIPFRDIDRARFDQYDYKDQDLGSGAPVLPPGTDLVLGAGKDGVLYVMDRNRMGQVVGDFSKLKALPVFFTFSPEANASPTGNLDFKPGPGIKTRHLHGSPVYWNSPDRGPMLFAWGENECLRAWKIDVTSGQVSFVAKSAEVASAALADPKNTSMGGMTGGMLTLSANGTQKGTGIVWSTAPIDGNANTDVVEGIVRAYDATVLDTANNADGSPKLKLLWTSKNIRNNTFNFSKFCPPFVADGKLFVTTYSGRVDVYALK